MMKTQALKSVVFAAIAAGLSSVGFAAEYWASPTGGGAGTSKDDPTSLAAALAAANAAGEASTVHLLKGEYSIAEQIVLGAGVSLVGAGRDETLLVGTDGLTVTMVKMSSAESALKSLTITNVYASTSGQTGSALNMTAGLVQGCRITHCATANANGGGVWLSGGLMTDSVVDHCVEENYAKFGNGIFLTGSGVVSNCEIYACKTFGTHTSSSHTQAFSGGGGVALSGSKSGDCPILTHCKIHDNGMKPGGGVWQNCGRVENCLFWGNREEGYTASTLYKTTYNASTSCETINCTFFGNKDSVLGATSVELYQVGGTTYNCIFWRDITGLPYWATDKVATVTGGEFANNVVKTAVSGYENNNSTGDPLFVDAASNDFHLQSAKSSAFAYGQVFEFITDDLDGVLRRAGKPDAGCYGYDNSKDPVTLEVKQSVVEVLPGIPVTFEIVLLNADLADYEIEWRLDGEVVAGDSKLVVPSLEPGYHSVRLTLTPAAGGETLVKYLENCVAVKTHAVFVNATGSGTFPYDTAEKGTNSVSEACSALWRKDDEPLSVTIGTGTFAVDGQVVADKAMTILGEGSNETVLVGTDSLTVAMFALDHSEAQIKNLTISNAVCSTTDSAKKNGGGIRMTAGSVEGCRITHCLTSQDYSHGGGIYLTGGCVSGCTVDHCLALGRLASGNGICMNGGGTVTNCEVCECHDFGDYKCSFHTVDYSSGSGIAMLGGGSKLLTHSRIHHNGNKFAGVFQDGADSRVVNCLIWGNTQLSDPTGHFFKRNGETISCTIVADSGRCFVQKGGTTADCIVWRATGVASHQVDDGTFTHNVVGVVAAGDEENFTGDPLFVDAVIGDFHLSQTGSSAYDRGLSFDFVTDDLDGRPRSDGKPDIGCYEYDSSKDPKEASIQASATDLSDKMTLGLKAVLSGAKIEDYSVEWTIDGRVAGVTPEISVSGLAAGSHAVALKLTPLEGGEPLTAGIEGGVTVWATKTYVNTTGNGTYPYATPETATNSLVEAMRALWNDGQAQTEVSIGEGLYELDEPVTVANRVTVVGAGWDKTLFRNPTGRGFVVDNAAASVSALTVTNSAYGISLLNGTVFDCRVTDCDDKSAVTGESWGGGISVENGLVYDCLVENIKMGKNAYARGAGIGVETNPSVVSNCIVRNCSVTTDRSAFGAGHGVSLNYAKDWSGAHVALLTHCTIENCGTDATTGRSMRKGGGLAVDWGRVENCVVRGCRSQNCDVIYFSNASARNCLFADNRGVNNAVRLEKATLDNCTIAGNCGAVTSVWAKADCKIYNSILSTVTGEYTIEEGATIERSCCPALAEGVNGNTAKDPKFKSVARGDYRLKGGSPCIDAGDNSRWDGVVDPVDLDGEPRIRYGIVDMGCYENRRVGLMLFLR